MTFRCTIIFVCFGVILASASDDVPTSTQKLASIDQSSLLVSTNKEVLIGYLERGEQTIAIYAGDAGPLYTIKTKDGEMVAEKIDAKQLQVKHPDLYHDIKSAVAGKDASLIERVPDPGDILDDK